MSQEFATALRAAGEPIRGLPVKDIRVGRMLESLFSITRDFDMPTQPHLLLLQKTMVMNEGVATALDPDINMWETAEPFLKEWIRSELGPEAYYADRIIELVRALKKMPDLIDRIDEYYPPRGAAPPPPPLPEIAVIEQKNWWGYALAGGDRGSDSSGRIADFLRGDMMLRFSIALALAAPLIASVAGRPWPPHPPRPATPSWSACSPTGARSTTRGSSTESPIIRPRPWRRRPARLPEFQRRLAAIDTTGWSASDRGDYRLVEAEMNGLDFFLRVLKPWARDPGYYQTVFAEMSDVPAHEGPSAEPNIDLHNFGYPLAPAEDAKLTELLGAVPAMLADAKVNLAGSKAHDLWAYGDRAFNEQAEVLAKLEAGTLILNDLGGKRPASLQGASPGLRAAVAQCARRDRAIRAVDPRPGAAPQRARPASARPITIGI